LDVWPKGGDPSEKEGMCEYVLAWRGRIVFSRVQFGRDYVIFTTKQR